MWTPQYWLLLKIYEGDDYNIFADEFGNPGLGVPPPPPSPLAGWYFARGLRDNSPDNESDLLKALYIAATGSPEGAEPIINGTFMDVPGVRERVREWKRNGQTVHSDEGEYLVAYSLNILREANFRDCELVELSLGVLGEMGIHLTQVTTRCRIGEMEDYPRNLAEFEARFATEQACREYLCQLRWPEGFRCPRCGHDKAWAVRTALLECAGCGHQASPTAGTIFQDTRQPLQSWFRAMWWLTSQKNGASALGLQRVLGLGSYKTAWTWLHKLRRAMVRPGRDRLSGRVEVDETYLGGLEEGVRGRQTDAKALIVVAAEEDGAGIGRVRIRTIPNASGDSLMAFVGESIEPGSVVHTDGWLGYEPLEGDGYRHEVSYLEGQPARASKLLPRVHRVVSLVKRWILGTHQGAVSHEHLDSYLDEFAFRFNRRKSRSRGKLFYRLVQQAVAVPPAPYKSLVGGTATRATDDHNM